MQKGFSKILIIVIIAAIFLLGGGYFMIQQRQTATSPSSTTTENQQMTKPTSSEQASGMFEGTFFDLLKGSGRECEFKMGTSGNLQPAKIWAGNGKTRSTITTSATGNQAMEANAIMKDGKVYSWVKIGAMAPIGFVTDQESMAGASQNMTAQQKEQVQQYQQKMSFNCKPWQVDESKFALPSDVVFK